MSIDSRYPASPRSTHDKSAAHDKPAVLAPTVNTTAPRPEDRYAAVAQLRPGAYVGTVRTVFHGERGRCQHVHRTRSAALECARRLDAAPAAPAAPPGDLTAANRARLDAHLDKLIRFDGIVRSWRGHLDAIDFSHRVLHVDAQGKRSHGLIERQEADTEVSKRGRRGLAFATYHAAPKLIVDYAGTAGSPEAPRTPLPLVVVTGYDDVEIVPATPAAAPAGGTE